MNIQQKIELIKRNTEEIIGENELNDLLKKKEEISVYWGTMPTGSPHISYLYPFLKIADFLKAGLKVKILIADLHAALDGVPWEILDKRQEYYKELIPLTLGSLGIDVKKLEFIKGSKVQLQPDYFKDVLKMSKLTNVKDAIRAASEVVKFGDNPKLGGVIYPIMQALDEEYLKVDVQFGGTDQRKIFVFARENLPKIGYRSRVEIMNYILPGLVGKKMSSSVEGSKVDLLDSSEMVEQKIRKAECEEGNAKNGLLPFLKYVIFTIKEDKKEKLIIERPEKFGGRVQYKSYEELERDFTTKKVHPLDLKSTITKEINALLTPIRKEKKLYKLHQEAYSNA